jgi:hypothetical protein
MRDLRTPVGRLSGALLAPLTAAVSALRRARIFHPDGVVYRAEIEPLETANPNGAYEKVARRLAGPALVRLSSAWWKGDKEWPDALGIAIRFRARATPSPFAEPGDQDLLLATILSPIT